MTTYKTILSSLVAHFQRHGATEQTIEAVRTLLPDAWANDLIFDALEALA